MTINKVERSGTSRGETPFLSPTRVHSRRQTIIKCSIDGSNRMKRHRVVTVHITSFKSHLSVLVLHLTGAIVWSHLFTCDMWAFCCKGSLITCLKSYHITHQLHVLRCLVDSENDNGYGMIVNL